MTNGIKPPLDLDDFRSRRALIVKERERARVEAEEEGIKEGEAEFRYRKLKAQAMNYFRGKMEMGVGEAEIHAEASEKVAQAKLERHTAHVLRRSAESLVEGLDGNRAMLKRESELSEGIE